MHVHTRSMLLHLAHLALLVSSQDRVKSGVGFRLCHSRLRREVTDRVRRLRDAVGVVVLDCGVQSLVRRLHAVMKGALRRGGIGEDGQRLLLLLRRE